MSSSLATAGSGDGANRVSVEILAEEDGERLDRVLAARLEGPSRSRIAQVIRGGYVSGAGGNIGEPSRRVKRGETYHVDLPPPVDASPKPEDIPLAIVHEDDDLIVIDKPAGMVVHPAPGHASGTLVNALLFHCKTGLSGIGGVARPGIVHRLDKDTSGLMVAAKTERAHQALSAQFADHGRTGDLERSYLAFAWGAPPRRSGTIDRPIGRHPVDRLRQAIRENGGREAITHYEIAATGRGENAEHPIVTLLRCRLETGRTHQVRVHLAALGCPLIGDPLYGAGFRTKVSLLPENAAKIVGNLDRQALHAAVLAFAHPADGRVLRFESSLPTELLNLRNSLDFDT